MFTTCFKQNFEGLLTVEFLKRLLEYTYIYNLNTIRKNRDKKEFRELKKNISNIIYEFIKLSLQNKRDDILLEYFSIIKSQNTDNPYLSYKHLKFLYYLNMKGKIIFIEFFKKILF
jgi:hypothetical protein